MPTLNDYLAWKQQKDQAGVGAANHVLQSFGENPDQAAANMSLATGSAKISSAPA